ncbi:uncharacterized protein A4U43_C08F24110 [Asparagus officinalis]|nr:uncharacterized protein A4U43_C08F24110 [Asparagus officinalis]
MGWYFEAQQRRHGYRLSRLQRRYQICSAKRICDSNNDITGSECRGYRGTDRFTISIRMKMKSNDMVAMIAQACHGQGAVVVVSIGGSCSQGVVAAITSVNGGCGHSGCEEERRRVPR